MAASDMVKRVGPPGKAYGGNPGRDEESAGDDEAAALGAMEEFMAAVKGDDVDEALRAYRNVKETC